MIAIVFRHNRCLVDPELSEILADPPGWYFYAQIMRVLGRKKVDEEKRVASPEMDLDSLANGVLTANFQEPLAIRADGSFYWKRKEEIVTLLFRSDCTHCPLEAAISTT